MLLQSSFIVLSRELFVHVLLLMMFGRVDGEISAHYKMSLRWTEPNKQHCIHIGRSKPQPEQVNSQMIWNRHLNQQTITKQ